MSDIEKNKIHNRRVIAFGSGRRDSFDEKYEKMPWIVLDDSDGLLVMSRNILKYSIYDNAADEEQIRETIRWDDSSLRFELASIFNEKTHYVPKAALLPVGLGTSAGDLVTILSREEAEKYLKKEERICLATAMDEESGEIYEDPRTWWLRNESADSRLLWAVDEEGGFYQRRNFPHESCGIRPVIRIRSDVPVEDYEEDTSEITGAELEVLDDQDYFEWNSRFVVDPVNGRVVLTAKHDRTRHIVWDKPTEERKAEREEADRQKLEDYEKHFKRVMELWDGFQIKMVLPDDDPAMIPYLDPPEDDLELIRELNKCTELIEHRVSFIDQLAERGYDYKEVEYLLKFRKDKPEALKYIADIAADLIRDHYPELVQIEYAADPIFLEYYSAYLEKLEKAGWKLSHLLYFDLVVAAYDEVEKTYESIDSPIGLLELMNAYALPMQILAKGLIDYVPDFFSERGFSDCSELYEKVLEKFKKAWADDRSGVLEKVSAVSEIALKRKQQPTNQEAPQAAYCKELFTEPVDPDQTLVLLAAADEDHEHVLRTRVKEAAFRRRGLAVRSFVNDVWNSMEKDELEKEILNRLEMTNALIVFVTSAFLDKPGYAADIVLPNAMDYELPILAVLCEDGLEVKFRTSWPGIPYIRDEAIRREGELPYKALMTMYLEKMISE